MELKKVRIQKYKAIIDTNWITIEKLTVLVGKNEAGKTTVLKALHKLNPFTDEPYIINKDWPRGKRRDRDENQIVCSAIFKANKSHFENELFENAPDTFDVLVEKNYKNELSILIQSDWFTSISEEDDNKAIILNIVKDSIPTFIYMSDYRDFRGTAKLDQLHQRITQNKGTEEDKSIQILLELSGLDLAEEVRKGNVADREERRYDLNDASVTLTNEIESRWNQRRYEIQFDADGQEFYTFIKDIGSPHLLKLEERSKGFQWFFSFDLMFMYESQGTFKNCVILLDEPGLHLHPDGQKDLLERLKNYAQDNVLIYSSHLPFMIDLNHPEAIRIISESPDGTKVSEEFIQTDPAAKFVLQAALGMSGSNSYLLSQKNLVVEGVDDYWILSELSNLMERNSKIGLDEDIFITPCGGASEIVYISTIMIAQKLNVYALFDEDTAGKTAKDKLKNNWLLKYNDTVSTARTLAEILKKENEFAIEDLLTESYYLDKVRETYPLQTEITLQGNDLLVNKISRFFESQGLFFNKGSVAKKIKKELLTIEIDSLPEEIITNVEALFTEINNELNRTA
jgi:predicted ATP-dependent endonuclease of OLD family